MKKYSLSVMNVDNPFAFLAELVLYQAFYDIECYYFQKGSFTDRQQGFMAEKWIRHMGHDFQMYASATNHPIEEVHQWCLGKINSIKEEARVRRELAEKDKQSPVGGERNTEVVCQERRPSDFPFPSYGEI